jgi:hypothetical protein
MYTAGHGHFLHANKWRHSSSSRDVKFVQMAAVQGCHAANFRAFKLYVLYYKLVSTSERAFIIVRPYFKVITPRGVIT